MDPAITLGLLPCFYQTNIILFNQSLEPKKIKSDKNLNCFVGFASEIDPGIAKDWLETINY